MATVSSTSTISFEDFIKTLTFSSLITDEASNEDLSQSIEDIATLHLSSVVMDGKIEKIFEELLLKNKTVSHIVIPQNATNFKHKHVRLIAEHCPDVISMRFDTVRSTNFTKMNDAALQEMSQLPKLQEIYLDGCYNITKEGIQTNLAQKKQLTALSLNNEKQSSSPELDPVLENNSQLEKLCLNGIGEALLPSTLDKIAELKQLKELHLMSAHPIFSENEIEVFVSKVTNLEKLILECSTLNDDIVKTLAQNNPGLTFLRLGHQVEITTEALKALGTYCTDLKTLTITNCTLPLVNEMKLLIKEGYFSSLELLFAGEDCYSKEDLLEPIC